MSIGVKSGFYRETATTPRISQKPDSIEGLIQCGTPIRFSTPAGVYA